MLLLGGDSSSDVTRLVQVAELKNWFDSETYGIILLPHTTRLYLPLTCRIDSSATFAAAVKFSVFLVEMFCSVSTLKPGMLHMQKHQHVLLYITNYQIIYEILEAGCGCAAQAQAHYGTEVVFFLSQPPQLYVS